MRKIVTMGLLAMMLAPVAGHAQSTTQSFRFDHYPTGPHVYDFPDRNPQADLAFIEQRRREKEAAENRSGSPFDMMGGGGTIAVGNWQQYYMILGDGADGTIINKSPQSDWGTQTSTSNENINSNQTQNNSSSWTGSFDGMTNVQQGIVKNCATCAASSAGADWNWTAGTAATAPAAGGN